MKKNIYSIIFMFGIQSSWSNPIVITPKAQFSELVFDENNHWSMELLFPYGYRTSITDSIILKASNTAARLKTTYNDETEIGVITSDSLSIPLSINRNGDIIELDTYSNYPVEQVSTDILIFGNYPGAVVDAPVSGYSIIRNTMEAYGNTTTIICLTKNPSLGVVNDTVGLSGTLRGNIYDMNNKPVTQLKVFPVSPCYFEMETPLTINQDGTYTTQIFRRFARDTIKQLIVRLADFDSWRDTEDIEPFVLNDIHPDTLVVQDIHLKDNEFVQDGIKNNASPKSDELTLINYPNPFNSSTNFFVKIPEGMKGKAGNISVYDAKGRLIKSIPVKDGASARWDGRDMDGNIMSSGIYYYKLDINKQTMKNGSMILLK